MENTRKELSKSAEVTIAKWVESFRTHTKCDEANLSKFEELLRTAFANAEKNGLLDSTFYLEAMKTDDDKTFNIFNPTVYYAAKKSGITRKLPFDAKTITTKTQSTWCKFKNDALIERIDLCGAENTQEDRDSQI